MMRQVGIEKSISVLLIVTAVLLSQVGFGAPPEITTQPTDQFVFAGETATFSVGATNPAIGDTTDLTYQWKMSIDGQNDPNLSTTDTLEIADANYLEDEAEYYCVIGIVGLNDANSVTTDYSKLVVKRVMGQWTFDEADFVDGKYLDVSGNGHDATVATAPTSFAVGADGQANHAVSILDNPGAWGLTENWDPAEFSGEVTISCWAKLDSTQTTEDSSLTHKRLGGGWDDARWDIVIQPALTLWMNLKPNLGISSFRCVTDKWTHLCITVGHNAAGQSVTSVYQDGLLFNSYTGYDLGTQTNSPMSLGARVNGGQPVKGAIDNYHVYNYAMTPAEIVKLKWKTDGVALCLNQPAMDYDGDCIVELDDLVMFATGWLNSGLYTQ